MGKRERGGAADGASGAVAGCRAARHGRDRGARGVVGRAGAAVSGSVLPGAAGRAPGAQEPAARRRDRGAAAAARGERVHRHAAACRPGEGAHGRRGRAGGPPAAGRAAGDRAGGGARGARAGSARQSCRCGWRRPDPPVRSHARGARPADRGERRRRCGGAAGADPVVGSGAVSNDHRRARRGARRRAPGIGGPSCAGAARRRAGGHSGGGNGSAGSGGERAALCGARCALRGAGDRAAQAWTRGSERRVTRDRRLVAGLDLGSTKTCAVIAEVVGDLPRLPLAKVLGVGLAKNSGVRRGMVRDIDETKRSVVAAQRAGYRVADLVLEPLAASYAVLTEDEKELGVALVEVGGGSTGVTIFHEGKIRHLASLRYAGSHVTQDLVQGLGVTQADAERLKERHGVAYGPLVDAEEMVNLPSTPSQGARQASRELLSHIIHERVDEIFQFVAREFERAGYGAGRLPAGVVLTGGTAHLPGMVELAREAFAAPVRAGAPEMGISGLVDSVQAPRYAVPVGLVLYAARKLAQGAAPGGSLVRSAGMEKLFGPLKRWLQDFF